jgi:DnaJ-class molecular chaperone
MAEIPSFTKCPLCHGEGVRDDGSQCVECEGTGQIPVDQVPPDFPE